MSDAVVQGTAQEAWRAGAGVTATAAPPAAAASSVGAAPLLTPTSVPTAFNVGWLLAELRAWAHDNPPTMAADKPPAQTSTSGAQIKPLTAGDDPPSRLDMAPSAQVKIAQITARITLISPDVESAGVPAASLRAVDAALTEAAGAVTENRLGDIDVDDLYSVISNALTAASIRVGRALDLGFDLANTCRMRRETLPDAAESAFLDLFGPRVVKVQEALADLATSLPEHAARGVALSLAEWQFWAGRLTLNKAPVSWPDAAVTDALRRQGEVWRAVLAGEKLGQDMLSADDYFGAMRELVKGQFLKRPWAWISLIASVALVIVGAIFVLANTTAATKVVGGVVPLLGAVGISAATLKGFAGNIAKELERQVWGAELDYAIAEALTVPPGEWRVKLRKIDTPPPRGIDPHITTNARIVRKVSEASRVEPGWPPAVIKAWLVRKYMDPMFTFKPITGPSIERKAATKLITHPVMAGFHASHVAAGAPGRLWTSHTRSVAEEGRPDECFLVWTFRENRHQWIPRQPRVRLVYLDEVGEDEAASEANRPRVVRLARSAASRRRLRQLAGVGGRRCS